VFGEEVVAPQYDKIHLFKKKTNNWALVEKAGLLGYINVFGEEVVKPKYDIIHPFSKTPMVGLR